LACDDDQGLLAVRHGSTSSARPAKGLRSSVQASLAPVPDTGVPFDAGGSQVLCHREPSVTDGGLKTSACAGGTVGIAFAGPTPPSRRSAFGQMRLIVKFEIVS